MGMLIGDATTGITGGFVIYPASKQVWWNTTGLDNARVYVIGPDGEKKVFQEGFSGQVTADFLVPGTPFYFELDAINPDGSEGQRLASATVNPDGSVSTDSTLGAGARSVPGGSLPTSWLDQSTSLFGIAIPNLGLAIGGGLLGILALKKLKG